jgi:hypothetical protein
MVQETDDVVARGDVAGSGTSASSARLEFTGSPAGLPMAQRAWRDVQGASQLPLGSVTRGTLGGTHGCLPRGVLGRAPWLLHACKASGAHIGGKCRKLVE